MTLRIERCPDCGEQTGLYESGRIESIAADKCKCEDASIAPCPFCGKQVHVNTFKSDKALLYYLMHNEQEGCPLVSTASYATKSAAIAAWNRRPQ